MSSFSNIQMAEEHFLVQDVANINPLPENLDFDYPMHNRQDNFDMSLKANFLRLFSENKITLNRSNVVLVRGIDKGAQHMLSSILGWRLFSENISTLKTCHSLPKVLMVSQDSIIDKKSKLRVSLSEIIDELTACGSSVVVFHDKDDKLSNLYREIEFLDSSQVIRDYASMMSETNPNIEPLLNRVLIQFKAITGSNPDWKRLRGLKAWLSDCTADNPDYNTLLEDFLSLSRVELTNRVLSTTTESSQSFGLGLGSVKGLSRETRTRLSDLADRLSNANEAPGVLLVGPPGSGKTMVASVLAHESERYFVSGSIATWQSKSSHLGGMLEIMSQAFEEASKNAPSVMFLDELDSIGTRGNSRDTHYWNVVINHLLELVQGISHRGDIALIGASNHPELIEPALLRAGRLGETIEIPLPTPEGVLEILQDMTGLTELMSVSDRVGSCSPADLKALVDEAKREQKRNQNLELTYGDLLNSVNKLTRSNEMPAKAKLSMCVRFASIVVSLKRLYGDDIKINRVSIEPGLHDTSRLNLYYRETESNKAPLVTAGDMLRKLNILMSASAAQTVFSEDLDNSADMFLGLNIQENENIKQLALKIVLANGTGTPAFLRADRPSSGSVSQDTAVQAVLKHVWTQVSEQVRLDKLLIWNIAKTLHHEKNLSLSELEGMLCIKGNASAKKLWLN